MYLAKNSAVDRELTQSPPTTAILLICSFSIILFASNNPVTGPAPPVSTVLNINPFSGNNPILCNFQSLELDL